MKTFTIDIWEGFAYPGEDAAPDGFRPTLDAYILKARGNGPARKRPAVVVLPGSGYAECSPRESEAVAAKFLAEGYQAFVLWYSCGPRRHPVPLLDCCRALTIIRRNAAQWEIDPEKIIVTAFSAGAHLALSEAVYYNADFAACPGVERELSRPDALVLGYPVVSSGEKAHRGSFENLLGKNAAPEQLDVLSLEKHIPPNLPPVFIWHTWTDASVPVENSLLLAAALKEAGAQLEMHIFPEGRHGLSLANGETSWDDPTFIEVHASGWLKLCLAWIRFTFGLEE
ncbi:MAG: alpha/beta hydrolase [Spirochaetaceae bacterium]|jgi:acetyl esterase/lipase|nr:alpha/beta hydrolase [Spirochaetaceae bacterium]